MSTITSALPPQIDLQISTPTVFKFSDEKNNEYQIEFKLTKIEKPKKLSIKKDAYVEFNNGDFGYIRGTSVGSKYYRVIVVDKNGKFKSHITTHLYDIKRAIPAPDNWKYIKLSSDYYAIVTKNSKSININSNLYSVQISKIKEIINYIDNNGKDKYFKIAKDRIYNIRPGLKTTKIGCQTFKTQILRDILNFVN